MVSAGRRMPTGKDSQFRRDGPLCAPFVTPASEPGSIPDSGHRRSRRRTSSTAEAAVRTEAGPRIGVRGDE